jgi:hypothetical protein
MGYLLEEISAADEAKILLDVDDEKRARLLAHGRFFRDYSRRKWAIDKTRNYFLMSAPTPRSMSRDRYFFMRFQGRAYGLRVINGYGPMTVFDDRPMPEIEADLKREVVAAFAVHKLFDASFVPVFEGNETSNGQQLMPQKYGTSRD